MSTDKDQALVNGSTVSQATHPLYEHRESRLPTTTEVRSAGCFGK